MKWGQGGHGDGCKHVVEYKRAGSTSSSTSTASATASSTASPDSALPGLERLRKAVRFIFNARSLKCIPCSEALARGELPPSPAVAVDGATVCSLPPGPRVHMCLHCVSVCCKASGHLAQHFEASGHFLAIDVTHRQTFCARCDDYIYDPDIERVVEQERGLAIEMSLPKDSTRVAYKPWAPSSTQEEALLAGVAPESVISSRATPALGLRGLCNLGNTCFTNCIIQALSHNPLLRNYFLSGMHPRTARCIRLSEGPAPEYKEGQEVEGKWPKMSRWFKGVVSKVNSQAGTYDLQFDDGDTLQHVAPSCIRALDPALRPKPKENACLGCVITNIFNELYSGEATQYAPYKLIHSVWQHSKHLAGYSQQDAHEFFIALLDGLHSHCSQEDKEDECSCIIHRIFTGSLQSDVTCSSCGNVSSTIDPFWDISLDIREASSALYSAPAVTQGFAYQHRTLSLIDCLERFTLTEKLGVDALVTCEACEQKSLATKRLSLKRLPVVVCFHLKRFEHDEQAKKIDTYVRFPEVLDLRPFLTHSIVNAEKRNAAAAAASGGEGAGESSEASSEASSHVHAGKQEGGYEGSSDAYSYSLFAVVNHIGTMQNGHYTCFVKLAQQSGEWFKCDDETVTLSTLSDVLCSQGYMLFYAKTRLEYAASD